MVLCSSFTLILSHLLSFETIIWISLLFLHCFPHGFNLFFWHWSIFLCTNPFVSLCASLLACCVFTQHICLRSVLSNVSVGLCFCPSACLLLCYCSSAQTCLFVCMDRWRSCWLPWKRWSKSWSPWRPSCRPPSSPWRRRRPTWPRWGQSAESTWRRCWKWSKTFTPVLHSLWHDTAICCCRGSLSS